MRSFHHRAVILLPMACAMRGAAGLLPRAVSNQTLFHHRNNHNSIVAGNYLYIDGGSITTWNGLGDGVQDSQDTGNIVSLPNNYTYSIDMNASWTNDSVSLRQIAIQAPVLFDQALWLEPDGRSFYVYDGGAPEALLGWYETGPPTNAFWQFEPSRSDSGSGEWVEMPIAPSSNFSALERVKAANYANEDDLEFALGGSVDWSKYHYDGWGSDPPDYLF